MTIHCAYCIHDKTGKYYINALVSIVSLFENTNEKVVVHILHDETLTDIAKKDFDQVALKYNQEVAYHYFSIDKDQIEKLGLVERFPNVHVRFMLPYILNMLDRVIYLDADTVINLDIKELYEISLDGMMLAAVKDVMQYWNKDGSIKKNDLSRVEGLGLVEKYYFNSGVMLLNLATLRQMNPNGDSPFLKRMAQAISANVSLKLPDQDAINSVMAEMPEKLLLLDTKFNYIITSDSALATSLDDLANKLVHLTNKPYEWVCPAQLIFWKYYVKTRFAENIAECLDEAFRAPQMRFLITYCNYSKHRGHAVLYLKYGFWGMLLYRLKCKLGIIKKSEVK